MEVNEKWGFGMAPVKPANDRKRIWSIGILLHFCEDPSLTPSTSVLESISEIKGLFTRIWKQDQWDWFTVFDRMGRPGMRKSRLAADNLKYLRAYLINREGKKQTLDELKEVISRNIQPRFMKHLKFYTGEWMPKDEMGQIYILSTRVQHDILRLATPRDLFGVGSEKSILQLEFWYLLAFVQFGL